MKSLLYTHSPRGAVRCRWSLAILAGFLTLSTCARADTSATPAATTASSDGTLPGTPTANTDAVAADTDPARLSVPGADAATSTTSAPADTPAPKSAPPSESVTINLIHLMVKRGLLSKKDAADLIKQAEDEALAAHEQSVVAAAQGDASASGPSSNETSPAQASAATPAVPAEDEDTVRVTYVPDVVKNQLRQEIKQDVMEEAREENWGPDSAAPEWTHRFHITGDIRVREEGDFFPSGNDNTGGFPNFNSINTGSGFNINPNTTNALPYQDVDQDRERLRLRARIGAGIDLGDNFTAGIRIASGQDDSPVTENQSLGLANSAQGGDFSKYALWLDRAFIEYDLWGLPEKDLTFTVGRFDNPFFSSSMIWANDIGFDGAVVKGKVQAAKGVVPFLTAGVFPVFNTDFNFSTDNSAKFSSEDKWLYAAQLGGHFDLNKDFTLLAAVAIYAFDNVQGRLSNPITPSSNESGNTDDLRPSFAQNGNTYMALRDFAPLATPTDTTAEYQYYGLATGFDEFATTAQIDFNRFDPFHVSLVGEYVNNLAYNRGDVAGIAVNNRSNEGLGNYNGGNSGYYVGVVAGKPALERLWDWNIGFNYRYVESDCVIDGFTDADFGGDLTGTNLKGYTLQANLALAPRIWLRLNFMSADAIAGPTFRNDLVQFDINAKF